MGVGNPKWFPGFVDCDGIGRCVNKKKPRLALGESGHVKVRAVCGGRRRISERSNQFERRGLPPRLTPATGLLSGEFRLGIGSRLAPVPRGDVPPVGGGVDGVVVPEGAALLGVLPIVGAETGALLSATTNESAGPPTLGI